MTATPFRILDIVDDQGDFMQEGAPLYVPGAKNLIPLTNAFFKAITPGLYDLALLKYDTHFPDEYTKSPEKESFPDIHCAYGTDGWKLAIDDRILQSKFPVYYMAKNTFDMWQSNPISDRDTLRFGSDFERRAYDNLYHVTTDRDVLKPGILRDDFMRKVAGLGAGREVEVTIIGVASDFCVDDAIAGYLQRGAKVRVVEDLVAGIGTPIPGRSATGHIRDVVTLPRFAPYIQSGQLKIIRSNDALKPGW